MFKIICNLIFFITLNCAWAGVTAINNLTERESAHLHDVTLEKGGVLKLEQYLSKTQALEGNDFLVQFKCSNKSSIKKAKTMNQYSCKLQNYNLLKRQ